MNLTNRRKSLDVPSEKSQKLPITWATYPSRTRRRRQSVVTSRDCRQFSSRIYTRRAFYYRHKCPLIEDFVRYVPGHETRLDKDEEKIEHKTEAKAGRIISFLDFSITFSFFVIFLILHGLIKNNFNVPENVIELRERRESLGIPSLGIRFRSKQFKILRLMYLRSSYFNIRQRIISDLNKSPFLYFEKETAAMVSCRGFKRNNERYNERYAVSWQSSIKYRAWKIKWLPIFVIVELFHPTAPTTVCLGASAEDDPTRVYIM